MTAISLPNSNESPLFDSSAVQFNNYWMHDSEWRYAFTCMHNVLTQHVHCIYTHTFRISLKSSGNLSLFASSINPLAFYGFILANFVCWSSPFHKIFHFFVGSLLGGIGLIKNLLRDVVAWRGTVCWTSSSYWNKESEPVEKLDDDWWARVRSGVLTSVVFGWQTSGI